MKKYFGYIRVSDAKQEDGASLPEQRDAVRRYAARHGFEIIRWFEETETAAKRGRGAFNEMIQLLRRRKAAGVIFHKIDRSTRNFFDWDRVLQLVDQGYEFHSAAEGLDLKTRTGRLSASFHVLMATDYIWNLREETRKGFYGRLKQGLYPMRAPVGYLDNGRGKEKSIDSVAGPLVRLAFEAYAAGGYTLETLLEELHRRGLRNRNGGSVTRNGLSTILNNPFYMGLMRIKKSGELFKGSHAPLVTRALFERVQDRLRGRKKVGTLRHEFTFRGLFRCELCSGALVAELQKARYIYYRCHRRDCAMTCTREEAIESILLPKLEQLQFTNVERTYLDRSIPRAIDRSRITAQETIAALRLQLEQSQSRLMRLTDAFLDGDIEKALFERKKEELLLKQVEMEEGIARLQADPSAVEQRLREVLELASSAWLSYRSSEPSRRRDLVARVTSNCTAGPENVVVELKWPYAVIANRRFVTAGDPQRASSRTANTLSLQYLDSLIDHLVSQVKGSGGDTPAEEAGS